MPTYCLPLSSIHCRSARRHCRYGGSRKTDADTIAKVYACLPYWLQRENSMVEHKAVDSCASIVGPWRTGWLCSCGRTILGKYAVDRHFVGRPMLSAELHYRRLEGFSMHIGESA